MDAQTSVLLYGLGAIGSFYAFILSRSDNVQLTLVARSNYDAVKARGIIINSQNHGEQHVKPDRLKVVKSAAEAGKRFDYVVCAHKAVDQASVPSQIEAAVDPGRTTVVIIQNGVGNEEPFRSRFPSTTILSCVTWVGARQPQPGFITHTKSENMQMGLFPNDNENQTTEDERLEKLAALLTAGKTVFQKVPNIQVLRWEKVVWNAAWNSLTTLTLMDTHAWLHSSDNAVPMTREIMTEVITVARAIGVPLDDSLVDRHMDKILGMPPIGSSMRTDFENGRPLEVDVILGYPVKKAQELGIAVPTIKTLYYLLTAINKRLLAEA